MRGVATVTDARRIGMRPVLVCAVVTGGILENIGRMRSLTADAHREISRRYSAIIPGLPDRCAMAGARA